ncbi:MAG: hypothetical protein ACRD22_12800, partial [Terriglobia bacterium]
IDLRLIHYQTYSPGAPFTFNFNTDMTQLSSTSATESGNEIATLLLGTPSSGSAVVNPGLFYSTWYVAPWIEDSWKVNHRLTINVGLRWDLLTPPTERYNRMNDGFGPNAPSPLVPLIPQANINQFPRLADLKGALYFRRREWPSAAAVRHPLQQLAAQDRHRLPDHQPAGPARRLWFVLHQFPGQRDDAGHRLFGQHPASHVHQYRNSHTQSAQ